MSNLLNSIGWNTYFIIAALSILVYYVCIGWTYYRSDIRKALSRFSRNDKATSDLPDVLEYKDEAR